MSNKLTQKEKRKTKRIEKNLKTKICTEVNSFGNSACPHCGATFATALDFKPKVGTEKCDCCGKESVITKELVKVVIKRKKRIRELLEKVTNIEYGDIDVIEAGIDKNCDINEVALLCKYFQCGLAKLSGHIKRLIPKERVKNDNGPG